MLKMAPNISLPFTKEFAGLPLAVLVLRCPSPPGYSWLSLVQNRLCAQGHLSSVLEGPRGHGPHLWCLTPSQFVSKWTGPLSNEMSRQPSVPPPLTWVTDYLSLERKSLHLFHCSDILGTSAQGSLNEENLDYLCKNTFCNYHCAKLQNVVL